MKMDELAAPAIAAVHDGRLRVHPESQRKRYLDWLAEHPALVHLAPALVGPPDPRLVPRRGDLRRHGAARGRRLGARSRRARHVVLVRPVAVRDARLARRHARAARVLPDRRALHGPRHPLPLGRAHGDARASSSPASVPFSDVYNHSTILAPDGRRMSKSLGTGIDPLDVIDQHGADGTRFGLLAMSSTQDVRFSEEKVAQGRQLANKLFNASRLVLLRAARGRRARRRRRRAPATVEDALDPLAARSARRPRRRARSRRSSSTAPRSASTTSSTASCATGTSRSSSRACTPTTTTRSAAFALGVLAETLAIAHPVIPFVTEEIWSHIPGAGRPADGAPLARPPTSR